MKTAAVALIAVGLFTAGAASASDRVSDVDYMKAARCKGLATGLGAESAGLGLGIAVSGPMTQSLVASSNDQPSGPIISKGSRPVNIRQEGGGRGLRQFSNGVNNSIQNVTSTLTPATFVGSIGIILLIAIIGSAVPAWSIARVRPAEVLRTE